VRDSVPLGHNNNHNIIIIIIITIIIIIITTTTTLFHEGKNTLRLKTDEPVALYNMLHNIFKKMKENAK